MAEFPAQVFASPQARTWIEEFSENASMGRLMAALGRGSAEEALAAAEIVAAMRGHASPDLPAAAWQWLRGGVKPGIHSSRHVAAVAREQAMRLGPPTLSDRLDSGCRRIAATPCLVVGDVIRIEVPGEPAFGRVLGDGQLACYRDRGRTPPVGSRDYLFTVPLQWRELYASASRPVARDPVGDGESPIGPPRFLQDAEGFWRIGSGRPVRARAAQVAYLERDMPWSLVEVTERIEQGDDLAASARNRWPLIVDSDGARQPLPWNRWPLEWIGHRPGTVIEIPLGEGRFAHGRALESGYVCFYRTIAAKTGEWPAGSRDFAFTLALEPHRYAVVGFDALLPGESTEPPPEWRQDAAGLFYLACGWEARAAPASDCAGFERHACAWTPEQVADRFRLGFRSSFWKSQAPILHGVDGALARRFWSEVEEVPLMRHDLDYLRAAGRREEAIRQSEELLESAWLSHPRHPWLADHLRVYSELTYSSPAAAQALEEACSVGAGTAEDHFRCALNWYGAGCYVKCLEEVAIALRLNPDFEMVARLLKASACLDWGDLAGAGVELRRHMPRYDGQSIARLAQSGARDALKCLRAKLCFVHGNHASAHKLYRQVCPKPKESGTPAEREALLMQATIARSGGRWEEAAILLRYCLETWEALGPHRMPSGIDEEPPGLARTLLELGVLLTARKRFEEADDLLREARRLLEPRTGESHPLVAITLFHRGWLAIQQGRESEASEHLCAALQIQWGSLLPSHPDLVRTEELLRVLGYLPSLL